MDGLENSILPALIAFVFGLPTLVFAVIQWSKTWKRENRQIAVNSVEAALREGQTVLTQRLDFEKIRRHEAEEEMKEVEEENTQLRLENAGLRVEVSSLKQENLSLRESITLLNDTTRLEERRMTDDRD